MFEAYTRSRLGTRKHYYACDIADAYNYAIKQLSFDAKYRDKIFIPFTCA